MGKTKVVLDTNIHVSGLGWKGNPHKIMQRVVRTETKLFTSYEQFEELSRVLDYQVRIHDGAKSRMLKEYYSA